MRARIRKSNIRNRTDMSLEGIANTFNPILNGWINYYGKYHPSGLYSVYAHFNMTLIRWARRKYKDLKGSNKSARKFIKAVATINPMLFAHWSRMDVY